MKDLFERAMALCVEVGECLEWQGPMGAGKNSACPILRSYNGERTKNYQVGRVIWEGRNGPIPEGKIVYRHCCNDRCVGCLRLGNPGDAQRHWGKRGALKDSPDRIAAAVRSSRSRASTKCTEEIADRIRLLVAEGLTSQEIADSTGMTPDVVKNVRRGHTWQRSSKGASVFSWRPA